MMRAGMISLFYVSRSAVPPDQEAEQLAGIGAVAQRRNLAFGVTGALVLVDRIFAQVLEGPEAEVNQLMVSILRDRRHSDVRIIEMAPIDERRFATWSMAFVPPSAATGRLLRALADPRTDLRAGSPVAELLDLMAAGAGSFTRFR
jgi:hypothetical protein